MSSDVKLYELVVAKPSTWSLRAWLALKLAGLDFKTKSVSQQVLYDKTKMHSFSATGLVPILHGDNLSIHDSLAIAEFANELKPDKNLWPNDFNQRAEARSLVAEIHSGFVEIRTHLPFFIGERKHYQLYSLTKELDRLSTIWSEAQRPFYFDQAGIIDGFYAVMAARLYAYKIELKGSAGEYQRSLIQWPLLKEGLAEMEGWE